ncbi:hypothetical protein B0A53_04325 [Rhodotorula sp. CCFEE 5036]|nr:hypothetical protein B0A53_04325 [Rhodotorula sp. CCFEE 5036]
MYSYYSNQPQQQQQPLQTLPSSPHLHHLASSSSSSPAAAGVQFGLVPGSQPGVLGWGIGMSSANGAGFGFGSAHASSSRAPAQASGSPSPASTSALGWGAAATASSSSRPASPSSAPATNAGATPTPNSRRRRRSPSPEQHGTDSGDDEHMSGRKIRPLYSANSKRARVQPATGGDSSLGGGSSQQQQQQVVVGDLGKALASLDKPALLDVFSRLLSTQPALAPLISTLLPTPSLSTVLATLASLERAVNAATPTGAFVRPEYVWSRVRVPVEEFVTESRRFIGLFVPNQAPPAGHTVTEEDLSHPSTCFEFLEALTRALLRLETLLPAVPPSTSPSSPSPSSSNNNPLGAHLMPLTLNAWHTFLTRLSTAVQSHGKVLPNSLVQSWFDRLDDLAAESVRDRVFGGAGGFSNGSGSGAGAGASASAVRRAMQGVRDRAKKELGWLVGLKNVEGLSASSLSAGMEGVEQEEEL